MKQIKPIKIESNSKRQFSLIRSSLAVSIAMLLAKIFSFIRDMLLARYLGATAISDAFLLSTSLVLTLSVFIRAPFAASYLPIATDVYLLRDDKEKRKFFGSVYGLAILVGVVIALVEALFLKPLLSIMVPGFSDESMKLLYQMMLLQLPIIPLSMLDAVSDGNLKLLNKFGISEISNAIIALFYIVYFLIFRSDVSALSISLCVIGAYVFSFSIRYLVVKSGGIIGRWRIPERRNQDIRNISIAMLPFMMSASAKEMNSIIDKAVASMLDAGSITIQTYASKLTVTEVGLIATAISTVIYSQVAKHSTLEDKDGLKKTVISGLRFVNTFMFPCCIFTIVFSKELISILFGHGSFSKSAVILTANTMIIYALGMIGSGIEEVLTRTMHATKHRKYPATVSVITVFLNTILNLILYRKFGVYGLAAASSFVLLLRIPFYAIYVHKKIFRFEKGDGIISDTLKIFFVCIAAGISAYLFKMWISRYLLSEFLILMVSGVVGVVICFVGYCITGNEYTKGIVSKIMK